MEALSTYIAFCRPHTIVSTLLVPIVVTIVYSMRYDVDVKFIMNMVLATDAFFKANVAIVGINQIYDVEVDRINKKYLPLASGAMSMATAWFIVVSHTVIGLSIAIIYCTEYFIKMYILLLLIGLTYSVPPLRTRNSALLASLSITLCRGIILPSTMNLHARNSLHLSDEWYFEGPLLYLILFNTMWALAISVFKDIPDIEGDSKNGIGSLAVKLGVSEAFDICVLWCTGVLILSIAYSIVVPSKDVSKITTSLTNMIILALFVTKSTRTNVKNPDATTKLYRMMWKILYSEYILSIFII